jgi:hypothetical protein
MFVTHVPTENNITLKVKKYLKYVSGRLLTPYYYADIKSNGLIVAKNLKKRSFYYGQIVGQGLVHSCTLNSIQTKSRILHDFNDLIEQRTAYAIGVKCYGLFSYKFDPTLKSDNVGSIAIYIPRADYSVEETKLARISALESNNLDKIIEFFPELKDIKEFLV